MRGADEDEGGDDDVEGGVVGYEHENAATISRQPDVVLRDEQLKQTRMRTLKAAFFHQMYEHQPRLVVKIKLNWTNTTCQCTSSEIRPNQAKKRLYLVLIQADTFRSSAYETI